VSDAILDADAVTVESLQGQVVSMKRELQYAHLKIQALEAQLRLQRIAKYGPSSEALSSLQLNLLEGEPGVSSAEVQAEAQRDQNLDAKPKRTRRPHPGRQELPKDLPRVERVIAAKAEDCACKACGEATTVIGYDESEQLDVEPARYFVLVTKREKRACKHCSEGTVQTAPVEARIIDKSLVSDRIILDTVISKYSDHLPLYRQSVILTREAGIEISRATMDGWVMRVGELLVPVAGAMRLNLLRGTYIQADETTVDVQVPGRSGSNHQAYLWQFGKPGGETVFDFRMGRAREGPLKFLGPYKGILQTDDYAAYDRVGGEGMVHAACWAHARRKFVDAVKLNKLDAAAVRMVSRMDDLFGVDAMARERGFTHEQRHALRQEKSVPMLVELETDLKEIAVGALPSSTLGKAANYTLSLWKKLNRFLEYPELELSNNSAENSMRGVALGRKNWIHIGSEKAGPKVAAILSVVESCRRLGVSARDYLADVLPGLADLSIQRLADRTPMAWKSRQKE
jgi:transposase